uniref:PGG domain-containing protein n=1 Tax=Cannabis sativa TaxID=3483 RepID=A0A803NM18_CANSA
MASSSTTLVLSEANSNNNNTSNNIITRMDSKLFQAAANGKIQVFKNTNQPSLDQILTPEKNTVVHVNTIASKTTHNTTFLEVILEMCPQLLLQTNARGETPLLMAARYGHDLIVEFLINRAKLLERSDLEKVILGGVDSSEVVQHMMRLRNKELDTALHEAVRFNHLKVVRILTREDPHFTYLANEADETPLYMAVEAEHLDLVDEILNTCSSPATTGPKGRNILHAAILTKNSGLTRKILENILDLTRQADKDGFIPLHYAVMPTSSSDNNLEIVKMLLEKDESSAYFKDKDGTTALQIAASNRFGGYELVKEILSRCPDSYEVVDEKGKNLLHYAMRRQSPSTLKLILDHSSLLNNYLLNRKDNEGNTPLLHMLATSPCYSENLEVLMSHPKVNKMLFNQQNKNILDMAYDLDSSEYEKKGLPKHFGKNPTIKSWLRKSLARDDNGEKILTEAEKKKIEQKEKTRTRIANFRESTLVAAALIATVTFTAGFTLPGGYISDEVGHTQQGSAVLRNNRAFQAFIITDTIALVLSTTAVFINLFHTIASFGEDAKEEFVSNYLMSMEFTIWAMGFMVVAFVTGAYSVLSLSNTLAITICVIGLSFFLLLLIIVKGKIRKVQFAFRPFVLY